MGFRSVQSNPERSLVYKTTSFASDLKKAENLFTSPLLKGGRVSPDDILSRYQYSEARRFHTLKQMAKDVEAMKHLGVPDWKIKQEIEKRKGLGKDVVSNLMLGTYTPKTPSEFFVTRIGEINRDLNEKEGVDIPNPFYEAIPSITNFINSNRRISLEENSLNLIDFEQPIMQQEPRITVHFAKLTNGGLPGSDTVIDAYQNKDADFHQVVADMAIISRKEAKIINLGLSYGMGKEKLVKVMKK